MADAAEVGRRTAPLPGIEFSALVASPNGAKRAIAAGLRVDRVRGVGVRRAQPRQRRARPAPRPPRRSMRSSRSPTTAARRWRSSSPCAWDCPFDGPTPPQRVIDIVEHARDHGADRLALADTIGTTTPRRTADLFAAGAGRCPAASRWARTSTTPAAPGLASAYAAVTAGVTRLDASVGGLGGCPFAPGRDRQHRHRGPGVPVARQRHRHRRRPRRGDRGGASRAARRRPRAAGRAAARRRPAAG